jgi:hypothetical protein
MSLGRVVFRLRPSARIRTWTKCPRDSLGENKFVPRFVRLEDGPCCCMLCTVYRGHTSDSTIPGISAPVHDLHRKFSNLRPVGESNTTTSVTRGLGGESLHRHGFLPGKIFSPQSISRFGQCTGILGAVFLCNGRRPTLFDLPRLR